MKALSVDGRPDAFQQPLASHHVDQQRDDLRIFLNGDESPGPLLEQTQSTVPEPPLHVAGRPAPVVQGVHVQAQGSALSASFVRDKLKNAVHALDRRSVEGRLKGKYSP